MTKPLKSPSESVIMTGYHFTAARQAAEKAIPELQETYSCMEVVRDEMVASGDAYMMEFSRHLKNISDAIGAMHSIGAAHEAASRALIEKGYRPPNKEEYAKHGSGMSR